METTRDDFLGLCSRCGEPLRTGSTYRLRHILGDTRATITHVHCPGWEYRLEDFFLRLKDFFAQIGDLLARWLNRGRRLLMGRGRTEPTPKDSEDGR